MVNVILILLKHAGAALFGVFIALQISDSYYKEQVSAIIVHIQYSILYLLLSAKQFCPRFEFNFSFNLFNF